MNESPRVAVVSGFGRGNWLAVELKSIGFDVALVDVSHLLGTWGPEDLEGPFGFLNSEKLLQSQVARLEAEDYSEEVLTGFCIWLKSGPIQFRGSISNIQLEKKGLLPIARDYLGAFENLSLKERQSVQKKIMDLPFLENWLAQFSHSFASTIAKDSIDAVKSGVPLPLLAPLSVRRVSRRGFDKSLNWVIEKGIQVYQKGNIQDLNLEKSVRLKWKGATGQFEEINADQIIWALSSEETDRLGEDTCSQLFNTKLEPEYTWIRQRLEVQHERIYETLPVQFVMIEDLALPWTHANLVVAQKALVPLALDIWVRIPTIHRFNKNYLDEVSQSILNNLKSRVPVEGLRWLERPQEYAYDYATLGPARFGQYKSDLRARLKTNTSSLLHFDGPEQWQNLEWTGQFQHQLDIFLKLKDWKTHYDDRFQRFKRKQLEQEQKERERALRESHIANKEDRL